MNTRRILTKTIEKIEGAYAPSTIRAYKTNFERFIEYCENIRKKSLPANPIDVGSYVAHLASSGLKSASIRIAVASISCIHKLNSFNDPTLHPEVKIELKRMHRKLGRSSKQALGITKPMLEKMINTTKEDLRGIRDKALMLIAYDSLCRRGELAFLRLEDIEYDEGMKSAYIRIRRSKTDQEAIGAIIRPTTRTLESIKSWVCSSGIRGGYLFRGIKNNGEILEGINPGQINRIYKRLAENAGLPKQKIKSISGHSLRIGAAQDLVKSGSSLPKIMIAGRWSKVETVMRYIERAETNN